MEGHERYKVKPEIVGEDEIENMFPSCPRCNLWKKTFDIETFRQEIGKQVERLRRDSSQFRMAEDYGLISENSSEVEFYFEQRMKYEL